MRGSRVDAERAMSLAEETAKRAYAPYSGFRVGAVVVTKSGEAYAGCNVENASYGLSMCAERNAAAAMIHTDPDDREIRLVAVHSPNAAPCFPCGACRQVLREFGCKEVVVEGGGGELLRYPFEEILPNSFGPEAL